ncbi:MAG TPA: DUF695 domain-containing protein [Caulobacter sp.]|nr:DUF695 domain-containing protein [Caulobacter sp.]
MAGPYADDSWIVGQTDEDEDGGLIIRCRAHLPEASSRQTWKHLILVGWTYEPEETGLPAKAVDRQMETFEEAVTRSVQDSGAGVLAASITGAGVREWRFYTIGPDAFMDALNTALEGHAEYPLEFDAFEDPDWNALAELLPG